MLQSELKPNQLEAIKQLEAALLRCKRAGLVLTGIDNDLHTTVGDDEFWAETWSGLSACEVMLDRANSNHSLHGTVNHYGCYLDSGGA